MHNRFCGMIFISYVCRVYIKNIFISSIYVFKFKHDMYGAELAFMLRLYASIGEGAGVKKDATD